MTWVFFAFISVPPENAGVDLMRNVLVAASIVARASIAGHGGSTPRLYG